MDGLCYLFPAAASIISIACNFLMWWFFLCSAKFMARPKWFGSNEEAEACCQLAVLY